MWCMCQTGSTEVPPLPPKKILTQYFIMVLAPIQVPNHDDHDSHDNSVVKNVDSAPTCVVAFVCATDVV